MKRSRFSDAATRWSVYLQPIRALQIVAVVERHVSGKFSCSAATKCSCLADALRIECGDIIFECNVSENELLNPVAFTVLGQPVAVSVA